MSLGLILHTTTQRMGFPRSSVGKEPACNAGDLGSIPGLGRPSGEENGKPLQHSCLAPLSMESQELDTTQ